MDEAERCHEIVYIAYGRLLTHGPIDQVIAESGLTTWAVSARATARASPTCRAR